MTPERDPFDELKAALDVEPSAGFEAGVRARTAESRTWHREAWLGSVVAVATAVVLVVVRPSSTGEESIPDVQTAVGAWEIASYQPPPASVPPPATRPTRATVDSSRSVDAPGTAPVVVSAGEAQALDRFLRVLQASPSLMPDLGARVDEDSGMLLPVEPIAVQPITPFVSGAVRQDPRSPERRAQ